MIASLAAPGMARLGEAPRWMRLASETPALYFTDLLEGTVYRFDGDHSTLVREFPGETVSALIPLHDGRAVVCLHRTLAVLDAHGKLERKFELDLPAGTRLSDATAGPTGHLWLGVVPAGDEPIPGMLLRVDDNGQTVAVPDLGFSNGIGFTADGRRLVLVDSFAGTVSAIDHVPQTGDLGERRVLYRHPIDEQGLDGLTIDEHDHIWLAVFGRGEVLCFSIDGEPRQPIQVPALRLTSCAFVGSTLYITSARVDAPAQELEEYPLAGSLFRCELGVTGGPVWKGNLS